MIPIADLTELLSSGESQMLEYKSSFDRETIETLVAFANTQGGMVLIGVADDGAVKGTILGKETLNEWLGQVKSSTSPSIIPDIEATTVEDKTVVSMRISDCPVKPVSTRGKYFKRIAAANHQLSLFEITELYMQSLQLSWDAYEAPHESLDTLSVVKIEKFIDQVNRGGRFSLDNSPLFALEKLKFVVTNHPTRAALLLFASDPQRHHIHIGRFKTPTTIIDDRQITDTLFDAVDQAMKFMVSHISVAFAFDGSLQRRERFAYPLPALREALLNAVVHRDYANSSDIQIKIFDDRITIFSPGKLYDGLTIEELKTDTYQSHIRNKLIAEAFYLTKNIEKFGSGFIRIRKELAAYPKSTFAVEENGGGVLITFDRGEEVNGGVNGGLNEGLNEGLNTLLQAICKHPGIQAKDLSALLNNRPLKTIDRQLSQLVKLHRIERKGSKKTGGYYVF